MWGAARYINTLWFESAATCFTISCQCYDNQTKKTQLLLTTPYLLLEQHSIISLTSSSLWLALIPQLSRSGALSSTLIYRPTALTTLLATHPTDASAPQCTLRSRLRLHWSGCLPPAAALATRPPEPSHFILNLQPSGAQHAALPGIATLPCGWDWRPVYPSSYLVSASEMTASA